MAITKASSSAVAPAAKGDLVVGNATNDSGVLAVGSTDQVLTVDSSTATGLKWATPATPSSALTLSTIASGSFTAGTTFSLSNLSSYDTLILRLSEVQFSTGNTSFWAYINNNTTAVYNYTGGFKRLDSTGGNSYSPINDTSINLTSNSSSNANYNAEVTITLTNCKSSGYTNFTVLSNFYDNNTWKLLSWSQGTINLSAAVSSIYLGAVYAFKNTSKYTLIGG